MELYNCIGRAIDVPERSLEPRGIWLCDDESSLYDEGYDSEEDMEHDFV